MTDDEPYSTAAGVEAAIKDAARKAAAADPSLNINERIRLEYFNRFLSRVFSEGNDSEWLLKGGTGMLARVPSTRTTLDIDLYRSGITLNQALTDLQRLSKVDLDDHFRFPYADHEQSIGGDKQPHTDGYRVAFEVFIGPRKKSTLYVDLVVGAVLTAPASTMDPANALNLPRLVSHEYRLYPVVDQIADKVCATAQTYRDRPSSREKDLVDLVVLAVTQDVDGSGLAVAISTEAQRRLMDRSIASPSRTDGDAGTPTLPSPCPTAPPTRPSSSRESSSRGSSTRRLTPPRAARRGRARRFSWT